MNKKDILCLVVLNVIGFGSLLSLLVVSLLTVFLQEVFQMKYFHKEDWVLVLIVLTFALLGVFGV